LFKVEIRAKGLPVFFFIALIGANFFFLLAFPLFLADLAEWKEQIYELVERLNPYLALFFHWLRARRERNHTPVEKNNNKHVFMIILYGSG
jgi:hypothetical protein